MPKVVYSDTKGLVQEAGAGFSFVAGDVDNHVGLHLYQEEITVKLGDTNQVAGILSRALPEDAIIHKLIATVSQTTNPEDAQYLLALYAWNHPDGADLNEGYFEWTGIENVLGEASPSNLIIPENWDIDTRDQSTGNTLVRQEGIEVSFDEKATAQMQFNDDWVDPGNSNIVLTDTLENTITFGFTADEETALTSYVLIYFQNGVDTASTLAMKTAEKVTNHPTLKITAESDGIFVNFTQDRAGIEGNGNLLDVNDSDGEMQSNSNFDGGNTALKWLYLVNTDNNTNGQDLDVKVAISVMYYGKGMPV